jgi:hypothetical protein
VENVNVAVVAVELATVFLARLCLSCCCNQVCSIY